MSAPTLSILGTSVVEGTGGTTKAVFVVKLSSASDTPVSVDAVTVDGTAAGGSDFVKGGGTLTIPAGQLSGTIIVDVYGDQRWEATETFGVMLSNPVGGVFENAAAFVTATGTILDDDGPPAVTIQNASVKEGNAGTTELQFSVGLSNPSDFPVSFKAATRGVTATPGVDYLAGSATVTIPAGQTAYQISVTVNGDQRYETNETLDLILSEPANAIFAGAGSSLVATGTILNDDPLPVSEALVLTVGTTPVIIELRPDLAPQHVARITELAQAGFYNGSPFHRVVEGFVAQGGKSAAGAGSGELLAAEFSSAPFVRGTVGMARATGVNTADSQFFVTLTDTPGLNGNYTVWGKVVSGMEAIDALPRGEPPAQPGVVRSAAVGDTLRTGTAAAERIQGGSGHDVVVAGAGDDTIVGGPGNDTVLGGAGVDTAVFSGPQSAYTIAASGTAGGYTVTGSDGQDTLISIEKLQFSDGTRWIEEAAGLSGVVHRFYNAATGTHFYTASNTEANTVRSTLATFDHEGLAFRTAAPGAPGATGVFRFYNTTSGTHFYTAHPAERDTILHTLPDYHYEGVAYQAYTQSSGSQEALYRFYNTATGTHFFTTSQTERDSVIGSLPTFKYEGIAFYVDGV